MECQPLSGRMQNPRPDVIPASGSIKASVSQCARCIPAPLDQEALKVDRLLKAQERGALYSHKQNKSIISSLHLLISLSQLLLHLIVQDFDALFSFTSGTWILVFAVCFSSSSRNSSIIILSVKLFGSPRKLPTPALKLSL